MFSTILSIRNMSQHKAQFTHLFDVYFYIGSIDEESTEDMEEKKL